MHTFSIHMLHIAIYGNMWILDTQTTLSFIYNKNILCL